MLETLRVVTDEKYRRSHRRKSMKIHPAATRLSRPSDETISNEPGEVFP